LPQRKEKARPEKASPERSRDEHFLECADKKMWGKKIMILFRHSDTLFQSL